MHSLTEEILFSKFLYVRNEKRKPKSEIFVNFEKFFLLQLFAKQKTETENFFCYLWLEKFTKSRNLPRSDHNTGTCALNEYS